MKLKKKIAEQSSAIFNCEETHISHACKYFNSEVAASRSEVMPCGIVKLLLRSSEVKCSAYRAEGTLHKAKPHFTCEAYFTFRASGTLSSKKEHLS